MIVVTMSFKKITLMKMIDKEDDYEERIFDSNFREEYNE